MRRISTQRICSDRLLTLVARFGSTTFVHPSLAGVPSNGLQMKEERNIEEQEESGRNITTQKHSPQKDFNKNIISASGPFSASCYRPQFSNVDIIDLLQAAGLMKVLEPIFMARSGAACSDSQQFREKLTSDSSLASAPLFAHFDQFSPLFTNYFTFEDRQLCAAGEVLLQHYMAESTADFASYYNLVLSGATIKQISAVVVNHYSLRLWAEDGCGLSRFLSAPPMLSRKTVRDPIQSSAKTSRLERHHQLRKLIDSLKLRRKIDTTTKDSTSDDVLPALSEILFQPPITQPSVHKDLLGTTFHHAAARFAKGEYATKMTHFIGLLEAEFGTDCALWFINERFQLREVTKGDEPLSNGEVSGVTYEMVETNAVTSPKANAPLIFSSLNTAANPLIFGVTQLPSLNVQMRVSWAGTVPNFVSVAAKHLSTVLERYPATSVCDAILHAQGMGCEYVGRSVLVPLPNPDVATPKERNNSLQEQEEETPTTTTNEMTEVALESKSNLALNHQEVTSFVTSSSSSNEGDADVLADILSDSHPNISNVHFAASSKITTVSSTMDATTDTTPTDDSNVLDLILSGANIADEDLPSLEPNKNDVETRAQTTLTLSSPTHPSSSSALFSLAASPKPGVVDQIGKWVSRASSQMERSHQKASADINTLDEAEKQKLMSSNEKKFQMTDGWLATPEKAPVWTNRLDFNDRNDSHQSNVHQTSQRKNEGGGGYLANLEPKVLRLSSDRNNVSGSFITHPHRKQTDQQQANWNAHDAEGRDEKGALPAPPPAPFVFPDYYNARTGRFDKYSNDKQMWKGPNANSKDGVMLTAAKVWRVGEREEAARREALLVQAAAKAQLHKISGDKAERDGKDSDTVSAALSVLFGGHGGNHKSSSGSNNASAASPLVGAPSAGSPHGTASPDDSLHIPKDMSVSEFIKSFAQPEAVYSAQWRRSESLAKGLQEAASGTLSTFVVGNKEGEIAEDDEQSSNSNSAKDGGIPKSLSAFLVTAARTTQQQHQSTDTISKSSSSASESTAASSRLLRKTHQRWFEVNLVAFPADLPSIAAQQGPMRDLWLRPSARSVASNTNTVKVSVSSSIAERYTDARVAASRKYLMSLVVDLEKIATA